MTGSDGEIARVLEEPPALPGAAFGAGALVGGLLAAAATGAGLRIGADGPALGSSGGATLGAYPSVSGSR